MGHGPFDPHALPKLTRFVYGTTRLGDAQLPRAERVRMARAAMDTGVWMHTSAQYGDALEVLGAAFSEDRSRVPPIVVKLGHDSIEELRRCAIDHLRALGVERIDLGQLCLGESLAAELGEGGRCADGLRRLQEEGLVQAFVLEVFPWTSEAPLRALQAGRLDGVIGGVIYYFNPLQRFASNPLWALLRERQVPTIALRTVAGGDVYALRDVPGAAWRPYLRERAAEVAPLFERSGASGWPEFCLRFAFSFPDVRATVGATSRPERLVELVRRSEGPLAPLPGPIVDALLALQERWSDETDVRADPWTM